MTSRSAPLDPIATSSRIEDDYRSYLLTTFHVADADLRLSDLQDSMRPVEVGDAELRAGISEVRQLIGDVPASARELSRIIGR